MAGFDEKLIAVLKAKKEQQKKRDSTSNFKVYVANFLTLCIHRLSSEEGDHALCLSVSTLYLQSICKSVLIFFYCGCAAVCTCGSAAK